MGSESFYINLVTDANCQLPDDCLILYNETICNKKNITLSFSLYSFFDGLFYMYSVIERYKENIFSIESRGKNIDMSINNFKEFFLELYDIWKDKLERFHSSYGLLLIKPNEDFIKANRKIKKFVLKL